MLSDNIGHVLLILLCLQCQSSTQPTAPHVQAIPLLSPFFLQFISPCTYPLPVSEATLKLLKLSLDKGHLNLSSLKGIVTGKARSGKTLSRARLFNMLPPPVLFSTAILEVALEGSTGVIIAGVRDVSYEIIQAKDGEWLSLSPQDMLKLVARAIWDLRDETVSRGHLTRVVQESCRKLGLDRIRLEDSDYQSTHLFVTLIPTDRLEMCTTKKDMARLIEACPVGQPVLNLKLLHFLDSGGQPQFHEVFPAFIHQTAIVLLTLKLSETLDACTEMEFCDERGVTYKEKCASLLNNEEILEHQATTLKAMSSGSKGDKRMKFAVMGTHRDIEEQMIKEGTCTETTAQKNRKLHHIFFPLLMGMLILFQPPDKIIFPVNVLNPNDDDNYVFRVLREKIMDAGLFTTVKIPVGWLLLKQDILLFAAKMGRKIIRVSECGLIAHNLNIRPHFLEAALLYFHSLNIFLYSQEVLPSVVFIDPQVPLNCVYEFVAFQFKLSCGAVKGVEALHYDNLMKGIVTLDFMNSEHFSKCYVPGLYEPQHAIKLFQSLFIASPLGEGKYLLPFLLPTILKTDIHKYRPSCSILPAFVVRFKTISTSDVTCAPNGIFCGLVASLLTTYKWIIKKTHDENERKLHTECMARNVVILAHDELPGKLTLINMQYFFEVHIEADERMLPHFCPKLREMILAGIQSVLTTFKYVDCTPVVAYLCPCSPDSHPAELKECFGIKTLQCTQTHSNLTWNDKYAVWGECDVSSSTQGAPNSKNTTQRSKSAVCHGMSTHKQTPRLHPVSNQPVSEQRHTHSQPTSHNSKLDSEPTLLELTRLKSKSGETVEVIRSLAPKWEDLATEFNFDSSGCQLRLFQCDSRGRTAVESCRDVLIRWLAGNGEQPATWRTLITILHSLKQMKLASMLESCL